MPRLLTLPIAMFFAAGLLAQQSSTGSYRVLKTIQLGGPGTFDTTFADTAARRLYIPRKNPGRIDIFDLDTADSTFNSSSPLYESGSVCSR